MRPIARPPTEEPNQASELASAGAEREPPRSAAIAFNPTALIQSEPNESDRSVTEMPATSHDVRVSMLGACKSWSRQACGEAADFSLREAQLECVSRRAAMRQPASPASSLAK